MSEDDSSSAAPRRFVIGAGDADLRLQQFLAREFDLSLSQTNRLLDLGAVRVDHWIAKRKHKGYKLTIRQVVHVQTFARPEAQQALASPSMEVQVIAADESRGWVVVNKPAGMPVHPLESGETNTVLNSVIARYPQMQGVGEGGLRSGVVHRLDVETSGTLVLATSEQAWGRLRAAFTEHRTTKLYRALALGRLEGEGEERMLLHIAQHRPAKVRVVDAATPVEEHPPGTRLCDLTWRAVETFDDATLIEVKLGTGFLHQIRAMLAQLGHPITGDAHYLPATMTDGTGAARPMLHASRLRVEEIDVTCAEPADFQEVMRRLRGNAATIAS